MTKLSQRRREEDVASSMSAFFGSPMVMWVAVAHVEELPLKNNWATLEPPCQITGGS